LAINTKLSCKNLTAYTRKAAEFNNNIVAENYNISTNSGNLTFAGTIEGNLNAKTTSGFVHFGKVKGDVSIKTSTGEVAGIDNAKPVIYGKANIETGRGRVVIDELLNADNHIKTAGGSINIETMMGGTLESPRGAINVGSMNSGTLNGGTKDVVVGSVSGSAKITSTKGNVYVGDFEGSKTARNITASSTNGKITLKNTIGSVNVATTNGEVELYNSSASAIKLESGKGVVATGLLGKVDISAKKDINVAFNMVSGDVDISGTAGCKNINITANKTELENVNVHLKTAGKNLLAKVYEGNSLTKDGAEIKIDSSVASAKNIKVTATGANINLYLKQA